MRYFFILLLIFAGCSNNTEKKVSIKDDTQTNNIIQNKTKQNINEIKNTNKIKINNLTFNIKNNTLIYDFNKSQILLFINNSEYSELQTNILKQLNVKYHIIKNQKLIQFFKIKKYPTIIITKENNQTKRYEGFIPAEILKYEIKD